jgi:large subunit ribosomal protein L21
MYAIVDIAGQQFKVEKDQKLYVHRLEGDEGKKVAFDKVMLLDTGSKVLVGDPVVKGASVSAKILAHVKGDKVLVFKKKRRKGYKKLNGHRQQMTQIQIEGISEKSAAKTKATAEKKEAATGKKAPASKAEAKPAAAGKSATAKTTKSKSAGVKSTAGKSTASKPAATKPKAAKTAGAKAQGEKKDAGNEKAAE